MSLPTPLRWRRPAMMAAAAGLGCVAVAGLAGPARAQINGCRNLTPDTYSCEYYSYSTSNSVAPSAYGWYGDGAAISPYAAYSYESGYPWGYTNYPYVTAYPYQYSYLYNDPYREPYYGYRTYPPGWY